MVKDRKHKRRSTSENEEIIKSKIQVVGIGSGACQAVNHMIDTGMKGVDYLSIDTDKKALSRSKAKRKLLIGVELVKAQGASGLPLLGRISATKDTNQINGCLDVEQGELVIIVAGLGGGTGSGAVPIIASLLKGRGALVVGLVTTPFESEGKKRPQFAEKALVELEDCVDTLIPISMEKLHEAMDDKSPAHGPFTQADDMLLRVVQGINSLVNETGFIDLEVPVVHRMIKTAGRFIVSYGTASGENKAVIATAKALSLPLYDGMGANCAKSVFFILTGGVDISSKEIDEITTLTHESCTELVNLGFSAVIDEEQPDHMSILMFSSDKEGCLLPPQPAYKDMTAIPSYLRQLRDDHIKKMKEGLDNKPSD